MQKIKILTTKKVFFKFDKKISLKHNFSQKLVLIPENIRGIIKKLKKLLKNLQNQALNLERQRTTLSPVH